MTAPSISIVLYAKDPAVTRRFYEALGLTFCAERHDEGPEHFACELGGHALEIYPILQSLRRRDACRHIRIVVHVDSVALLDLALPLLCPGVIVAHGTYAPANKPLLRVVDPDGVNVLVLER